MPQEELAEDFDDSSDDTDTTDHSSVVSEKTSNSNENQATNQQATDSTYNFEQTTVIVAIQILPAIAHLERQVLISAGIKGSPPIISSTRLAQLEQVEALANILEQLKQALPGLAEKAKLRAENQRQNILQHKQSQRVVSTPELPPPISTSSPISSQLSLF